MNLLIPAAGQGMRFVANGYTEPKPFIRVAGKPMVQHVLDYGPRADTTILALRPGYSMEHAASTTVLPLAARNVMITQVPLTDVVLGTAGTVTYCASMLPLTEPVLVMNCDNIIRPRLGWDSWENYVEGCDAAIATWLVADNDPAAESYSYVQLNKDGTVRRVAEKEEIGPYACAGAFYFSSAALLYAACKLEIENGILVKGEHYLAPAMNQLIARGCNVYHVPLEPGSTFIRIGTPEDMPAAEEALNAIL